jgi:hypothetical protein
MIESQERNAQLRSIVGFRSGGRSPQIAGLRTIYKEGARFCEFVSYWNVDDLTLRT